MIKNPDPIVRNRTNNSQRLRLTFSQLTNIRPIHNLTDAHAIYYHHRHLDLIETLELRICAPCDKTDCSIPPSTVPETPKKAGSGNGNSPSCNHPAREPRAPSRCERLSGQTALFFFLCHLPIHTHHVILPGPLANACAAAQSLHKGMQMQPPLLANE